MRSRRRGAADGLVVLALLAAVVVAGCGNQDDPEVPEVSDGSSSGGTNTEPGTGPSPSGSSTVGVPEQCSDLITFGRIVQILEVPIEGETVRIFNDDFLADSGRTGRLTCSYGVPSPPEAATPPVPPPTPAPTPAPTPVPPPLEIAVSSYIDAPTASGRIDATVDAVQGSGGQVQAQPVGGRNGFVLTDAEDVSFVVADDLRTYVITLRRGVVPPAAEPVVLLGLAGELLGAPSATPSPPSTTTPTATATATATP